MIVSNGRDIPVVAINAFRDISQIAAAHVAALVTAHLEP
jgi:hypothetical protein